MAWYWLTVGFFTVGEAGCEFTRLSCQALMPMTAAATRSRANTAATIEAVRPKTNLDAMPEVGWHARFADRLTESLADLGLIHRGVPPGSIAGARGLDTCATSLPWSRIAASGRPLRRRG